MIFAPLCDIILAALDDREVGTGSGRWLTLLSVACFAVAFAVAFVLPKQAREDAAHGRVATAGACQRDATRGDGRTLGCW